MSNPTITDSEIIKDYQVGSEIGKGSFANVYKGISLRSTTPVAIKKISKSKLKTRKVIENLEIEIQILKTVIHPHVVSLIGHVASAKNIYIIMEYCSLGDLSYFIKKRHQLIKSHPLVSQLLVKYPSPPNCNGLNRILIIHFLKQLASAIQFLRSKNLVHRDLKPQNLLLCYPCHSKEEFEEGGFVGHPDLPILKIADFGFARFLPNSTMAETLCGSPLYMAPEILGYEKYNAKADLWSVGAVLYEMSVGKPPFKANNHVELLKRIQNAKDHIDFPESLDIDYDIKRVICGLLKYKAIERMSFNEFFNDKLVLYDFNEEISDTQSLDHSSIDESLFISEYLPQNKTEPVDAPVAAKKSVTNWPAPQRHLADSRKSSGSIKKQADAPERVEAKKPSKEKSVTIITPSSYNSPPSYNSPTPPPTQRESSLNSSKKSSETELLTERDYVVVEKKTIEVNALADEVAALSVGKNVGNKVITTKSTQERKHRSSSSSQKRPSFGDRRFSISLSPSNALSKALGIASTKLWGVNTYSNKEMANYMVNEPTLAPHGFSPSHGGVQTLVSSPSSSPGFNALNSNVNNTGPNEYLSSLVSSLERISSEAHAVNSFAMVKYSQLVPSPPSAFNSAIADDSEDEDCLPEKPSHLTSVAVKSIAEEGLALYIKTLSLLAKAMNMTSEWWYSAENGSILRTNFGETVPSNLDPELTHKLNTCVQWIRDLFNSSLVKADLIRLQLNDANEKLGLESENSLNTDVIAEKLIFDRALEISRDAAVNELVGEDLAGCEVEYYTSIWMLEAILDTQEPSNSSVPSNDVSLDKEDRAMVQKFIDSIANRLSVLRKKIDVMNGMTSVVAVEKP